MSTRDEVTDVLHQAIFGTSCTRGVCLHLPALELAADALLGSDVIEHMLKASRRTITEWNAMRADGTTVNGVMGTTNRDHAWATVTKSSPGLRLVKRERTIFADHVTEWVEEAPALGDGGLPDTGPLGRVAALARNWIAEDDTTQWGTHDKSACGRAILAALGGQG
jgi:hypothetical protein